MQSNDPLWTKLIQWIKKGRLIPIIGPDLLMIDVDNRSVPLYRYLAEQVAARFDIRAEDIPEHNSLSQIAVRVGRSNAEALIADLLEKSKMPIPPALLKLAQIEPLRLFVLTTFDPFLAQALDGIRGKKTNSWRYATDIKDGLSDLPEGTIGDDQPHVFHLFGNARDGGSFVITEGDTVDFMAALLSKRGAVPTNLLARLKESNLLLVGNRFHDWLARFFIRLTNDEPVSAGGETQELFADDVALVDQDLKEFFLLFRKERTHIYQSANSSCTGCTATRFVDALAAAWEKEQPRQAPARTTRPTATEVGLEHGSVFISYERNVMRAALIAAERLQASGVSYWLDRQNIKGGQNWKDKIREGIEHSSVFMPLISQSALNKASGYVFEEWQMALSLRNRNPDREFVIPVVIDEGAAIPRIFSEFHYEEFLNGELSDEFIERLRALQRRFLGL